MTLNYLEEIEQLRAEKKVLVKQVRNLREELTHLKYSRVGAQAKPDLSVRWTHDMVDQFFSILVRDGDEKGLVVGVPESELRDCVMGKFPAVIVRSE